MTSFNYTQTLSSILQIESSNNVDQIVYGDDLKIWPVIRIELYTLLLHNQYHINDTYPEELKSHIPQHDIFENDIKNLLLFAKNNNSNYLFFYRNTKHIDCIKNNYFNPYIDPVISIEEIKYDSLKIEIKKMDTKNTLPRYFPTFFVSPIFTGYYRDYNTIKNFQETKNEIFNHFRIDISESCVIKKIRSIIAGKNFFIKILSIIRPKCVFLECYYYDDGFSLVLACKELNIKIIDLQHGYYGKYHAAYTHWKNIPLNGFNFLPDYFWCWGKKSYDNIKKWYSKPFNHHKPIIGGNLRYVEWFKSNLKIDKSNETFYNFLKKYKKVILITLQGENAKLPQFFFDAINESPNNWIWLFRLHPVVNKEQVHKQLIYDLSQHNIAENKIEIENATKLPIFELFSSIHHHVTGWSTVSFDALAFDIPTTFINKTAYDRFDEEINDKIFSFAQSKDELLYLINNGSYNNTDHRIFIETATKKAKVAISEILFDNQNLPNIYNH